MSTLVLFSGGMDSCVALFSVLASGEGTYALTFNYGQKHDRELTAARHIWLTARQSYDSAFGHRILTLPCLPRGRSSLLGGEPIREYDATPNASTSEEDPAFIPHRNLIFLSIAAAWARYWGSDRIVTGLRGGFPDCTEHFELRVSEVLEISDPTSPIVISSPVHRDRAETILIAQSIPHCWEALSYSLTCYAGTETPCGRCLPCTKRAEGFAKVGLQDPLLVRLRESELGVGNIPPWARPLKA